MLKSFFRQPRPFWHRYLILIGVDTLVVFGLSSLFQLLGGINQVSNLYFLSCLVFLVIAIVPVFSEVGGNIRMVGKIVQKQDAREWVQKQEEQAKAGSHVTFLYGLAAITTFILAFIFI